MDDPTPLALPPDLPYPVTLTRLLVAPGDDVARGSRLLEYSFLSATARRERAKAAREGKAGKPAAAAAAAERGDDMVGSWECSVKGTVDRWEPWVIPGAVVEQRHASRPVIRVAEPCTHPVQLHGMCGVCGADLTEDDYLARPASSAGPSRPAGSYELAHDAMGVTVSTNEARRLETLARDTLLASRKLSLIVDLDQTIIHTTVDPTVGEWMAEIDGAGGQGGASRGDTGGRAEGAVDGEEDDTAAAGEGPAEGPARSTTPPMPPAREVNPNAEALKDVARFQLADDLPSGARKGNEPVRWYYTKPRPGLTRFLETMSERYELHVYTMGTRTYADAICNVIDPDGKIFGGRVLSRDESGSMSSKSLIRLFPTDHSMVVVIDDRSDVWGDCPNLVKVIPYDFFVGIGDINGSFLPPQPTLPAPVDPATSSAAPAPPQSPSSVASSPPPATPEDVPEDEGIALKRAMLDEVAETRPLAKAQVELERAAEDGGAAPQKEQAESAENEAGIGEAPTSVPGTRPLEKRKKPLLNAYDYELERISDILTTVHADFYRAYDSRARREIDAPLPLGCDVELIIPALKARVLEGCVIVFSAVIPRGQRPEESEIWLAAEAFGARVLPALHRSVTHLVTNARGTEKAVAAERLGAKVVWLQWLSQCMARWERLDEADYDASPGAEARERWEGAEPAAREQSKSTAEQGKGGLEPPATADASGVSAQPADPAVAQEANEPAEADEHDAADDSAEAALDEWGHEWDEADDQEFADFMEGGSDYDGEGSEWEAGSDAGSVAGSTASRVGSAPSTPRKRVRYADEESKPLESFKDPSPDAQISPKKRPRALLLPPGDDDDVPDANRFEYKRWRGGEGSATTGEEAAEPSAGAAGAADVADTAPVHDGAGADDGDVSTAAGDEDDDDEFAKMLAESVG